VLGQACAETCDLLTDWLVSDGWGRLRQRSLRRVEDAFYNAAEFLDEPLAELLTQVNEQMDIATAEQMIRQAHQAVRTVARRCPHWRQAELFAEAESRLGDLRGEICALTAELRISPATPVARDRVRTLLRRAVAVIPTLALAMAGASPAQMRQDFKVWEHDASRVIATYLLAQQSHPAPVIAPPQLQIPEPDGPEAG
jgi:hypothetical protein